MTTYHSEETATTGCPVDHSAYSRKTMAAVEDPAGSGIIEQADGVWKVTNFAVAKQILRSSDTLQAGFQAELLGEVPTLTKPPMLFMDGVEHGQHRKATARFFTPKKTQAYRDLMIAYADQTIEKFIDAGRADLSEMTMELAVLVAGQIVGLPERDIPGMARRITRLVESEPLDTAAGLSFKSIKAAFVAQVHVLNFLYRDVKPAIRERRKAPQEDVISHVMAEGYTDLEILTECVMYGAAGMATTREFISIAFMHLMENDTLRKRFMESDIEKERHQILNEILRLEPVVANLYRRAAEDLVLETAEGVVTIPAGALIDLDIYATNADQTAVGEDPHDVCPHRELAARVPEPVMAFGDGHHRCPGAYVAIQESDIFLRKLLSVDGLHIEKEPTIHRNENIKSYEIRDFIIAV